MAYLSCVTSKEKGRVHSGTGGGLLCEPSSGFPHEAVWNKTRSWSLIVTFRGSIIHTEVKSNISDQMWILKTLRLKCRGEKK